MLKTQAFVLVASLVYDAWHIAYIVLAHILLNSDNFEKVAADRAKSCS